MRGPHTCPKMPMRAHAEDLGVEWVPGSPTLPRFDHVNLTDRKEALFGGGSVEASWVDHAPVSADDYWSEWYGRVASWGDISDAGYPKMPDDYTPAGTGGRATSGRRHTHRMRYATPDGFEIRMPSATSIRRFAADEVGGRTFEVPVAARAENGHEVMVSVRCTWNGPGSWTVEAPAGDQRFGRITEAVNSVLEARRVSVALRQITDLSAKRKQRILAQGSPLVTPHRPSAVVSSVSVIGADKDVVAVTIRGRLYGYRMPGGLTGGSRAALIDRLMGRGHDPSPGGAYNDLKRMVGVATSLAPDEAKGQWHPQMGMCPVCECVYLVDVGHRCRLRTTRPVARLASPEEKAWRDVGWSDAVAASHRG